jgi:hypothetical protein
MLLLNQLAKFLYEGFINFVVLFTRPARQAPAQKIHLL